ncbi:DUF3450 domain-containing protein [Vibrio vulnificus]|uniref:DUF3450 domain-containing protein n=1 Tax=Vibrio vulnificus TaxID=672 RepID=UPI00076B0585|nr:DUF3450 domain-containing protein [Vibrio vulnificus]AMG10755.1 hypothetical protein AL549_05330 [Vibrio vulnificus]ELF4906923.1 DUF3450 domain-containing protein [Vibrio vulnificus]ELG9626528.1 DUF3450 domain-containing protein [Vibrio vulnificus]ELJ0839563.1 DUF3450 domain-containing protein [Vibrio vulnificus]MCU8229579.1 DUF3450 domain-containing protein [Vibrio vulnificus]
MSGYKAGAALLLWAVSSGAMSNDLEQAQKIQNRTHTAASKSQSVINVSADKSQLLQAEIEILKEEVRNLELYQRHLTSMIANQEQEKSSLAKQIQDIQVTRQGIVPLMYDMLDTLKTTINQDMPIKWQQRQERIEKLEQMMVRADVADAEKFRRILEAYQIELDYGSKLSAYQDPITLADGKQIEVEQLHLGRVSLIARTLNANQFWYWDKNQRHWLSLTTIPSTDVNRAFDIAAQKVAPAMLNMPVALATAEAK